MTEQSRPPPPPNTSFYLCTLHLPATDSVSGAAFNWAVEVQASTTQTLPFLTTRHLEPLLFYECMM